MTIPAAHTRISRADVLWRRVLDGVLVRVTGSADSIVIEGTGVAMWELLGEQRRFGDMCGALAESHRADPETVASDLAPVISDLVDRGVLSVD